MQTSASLHCWKAIRSPLNGAALVKKMHLWAEQQFLCMKNFSCFWLVWFIYWTGGLKSEEIKTYWVWKYTFWYSDIFWVSMTPCSKEETMKEQESLTYQMTQAFHPGNCLQPEREGKIQYCQSQLSKRRWKHKNGWTKWKFHGYQQGWLENSFCLFCESFRGVFGRFVVRFRLLQSYQSVLGQITSSDWVFMW